MEKMMAKGLALEELEAHSHAELLPDRIEMRRSNRRRKRVRGGSGGSGGDVTCTATNVGGLFNFAQTLQICQRINA
jgi:hypothetical protein